MALKKIDSIIPVNIFINSVPTHWDKMG